MFNNSNKKIDKTIDRFSDCQNNNEKLAVGLKVVNQCQKSRDTVMGNIGRLVARGSIQLGLVVNGALSVKQTIASTKDNIKDIYLDNIIPLNTYVDYNQSLDTYREIKANGDSIYMQMQELNHIGSSEIDAKLQSLENLTQHPEQTITAIILVLGTYAGTMFIVNILTLGDRDRLGDKLRKVITRPKMPKNTKI